MMHKNSLNLKSLFIFTLLCPTVAFSDPRYTVSSGIDYSTGKYGDSESTDITYIPIVVKYENEATTIKLTLPWVEIKGPGDVVGLDGIVVKNQLNRKRMYSSGVGDIVLSGTRSLGSFGDINPITIDLTGKVKFATASKSKGLGTGENDYTAELSAYKSLSTALVIFGDVGYKLMGDSNELNLNNVWFTSAGLSFQYSPNIHTGIMADYRQKTLNRADPLREISTFASYRFNQHYKLQTYLTHGYSDASPDWGVGTMLGISF